MKTLYEAPCNVISSITPIKSVYIMYLIKVPMSERDTILQQ